MGRQDFQKEMRDGESATEFDGIQFKKEMDRELKGAERSSCNEKYDIRDTSVRGDPFCPSGRKVVDSIIRSSEKPSVGTNADLHSDTTEPGENMVTSNKGNYARKMSDSAEWLVGKQKDKKVPDAVKRKVFNS
jgi:hypothetical protein